MTLLMLDACDLCNDLHEIDCPGCEGMGLLHDADADPADWNVCAQCDGNGSVACPECLEAICTMRLQLYSGPVVAGVLSGFPDRRRS